MTEQPPQAPLPDPGKPDPSFPPQGAQPDGQPQYGQPQYGQPQYDQPQYGQPQYGQPQYPPPPSYGQAPQQPTYYGAPGYGGPAYYEPPAHGSATTALILGILGLVLCPLVLSIPAWVMGRKAMREIDASGGQLSGRGNAKAGFILGIIGTIWGGLTILFVIAVFAIGGVVSSSFDESCGTATDGSGFSGTQC